MLTRITRFINNILAALLAGTSFGIWMGFNPLAYSPSAYIEQQQHLVNSLNTLMVFMVICAFIVTLFSAYLQRKNKRVLIMLLLAAVFYAACILISRFGNLPVQKEILGWKEAALPENWTLLRDKWWLLHIYRTIAELAALLLVSWTLVQKQTTITTSEY